MDWEKYNLSSPELYGEGRAKILSLLTASFFEITLYSLPSISLMESRQPSIPGSDCIFLNSDLINSFLSSSLTISPTFACSEIFSIGARNL